VTWKSYLEDVYRAALRIDRSSVSALAEDLLTVWREGRTVFTCGNGGSASNASHLAQDLSKGTRLPGVLPLRTISLCDNVSALTAWANDQSYAAIFAEQIHTLGQAGDLLIAISGSGNSQNILVAVSMARALGLRTWGVTGFDGGKLLDRADRCVHVPCDDMGQVEAVHAILFHWLVDEVKERRLSGLYAERHYLPPLPPFEPRPLKFFDDDSLGARCPGVEK
jgi:D-sedoheptulose 7-phosphate isomerase